MLIEEIQTEQWWEGVTVPLLELVRLQAIQVRQERLFGEIAVRKHTHFDEIMNQQAAVRDDWR